MEFQYNEKMLSNERKYTGGIIAVDLMTVALPNGKEATRDVVVHPGAAVVIPVTDEGEVYVVRQFRAAIGKAMIELPAGKLDKGEDPLECAKRELLEETGLEAQNIKHVTSFYSTPGFSNEILHMYLATGLTKGIAAPDEDEFLTLERIPLDTLCQMIFNNEITDAKTMTGILMADRIYRDSKS